ncbi:ABC transporter ATP-binding protein [Paenibacillus sp. YPG26]|uniref:ABC transporter ATP-binding protein n=1 Tax=Paenibacillus sp. YPG26 TaxID=2878915 RepID=UPI0020400E60|nr:ABC transporter ATP-binding protein [Paenibacillus sp. YPG26]USB33160.1 ABC transporter ATP-binding protein [Paenibacillus sp. YPG26]
MTHSPYLLQVESLNVSMRGVPILDQVNLTFKKGRIYGLLGPNGAGKTTLLKVLLGIYKPTSGKVMFGHQDLYEGSNKEVRGTIGSIIEFPGFYENLTLFENLDLHLRYQRGSSSPPEIDALLKLVSLYGHRNKLFSQTSLGMKQRLGIARAMAHQPQLLLLDEPTNGLDPQGIREVRDILISQVLSRGMTVIVSSHILSEINLMADELIIMNQGRVVFVTSDMKKNQPVHSLEDLYLQLISGSQAHEYAN